MKGLSSPSHASLILQTDIQTSGGKEGQGCVDHKVSIMYGDNSANIGTLCGYNSGQHLYIHLPRRLVSDDTEEDMEYEEEDNLQEMMMEEDDREVRIVFDFSGDESYIYNLKVTQVCSALS